MTHEWGSSSTGTCSLNSGHLALAQADDDGTSMGGAIFIANCLKAMSACASVIADMASAAPAACVAASISAHAATTSLNEATHAAIGAVTTTLAAACACAHAASALPPVPSPPPSRHRRCVAACAAIIRLGVRCLLVCILRRCLMHGSSMLPLVCLAECSHALAAADDI